jgi:LPS sulfotransferase NodH
MWLDPTNSPTHDLPRPMHPPQLWLLASTPRTGSTLLGQALASTGLVGEAREWLNPMQLRDWGLRAGRQHLRLIRGPLLALLGRRWSREGLEAHLAEIAARRSQGGWMGLKLHWHHAERLPGPPLELLRPARILRIRREDRLGQAISWARAQQTGQWSSAQRPDLPPLYSRRRIQHCLDQIGAAEAGWDGALEGRAVLELRYEVLQADLPGVVALALRHLGLPAGPAAAPPRLAKQRDALSEEWRQRFLSGR